MCAQTFDVDRQQLVDDARPSRSLEPVVHCEGTLSDLLRDELYGSDAENIRKPALENLRRYGVGLRQKIQCLLVVLHLLAKRTSHLLPQQ